MTDGAVLGELFTDFIQNPLEPLVYHGIFMALTVLIVIGGVAKGIERYSKIMMPSLFVMMILLMIRSLTLPGAMEGVKFLLIPDFSKINAEVILAAMGQVFFSLSLGMGTMITYGSYLSKEENLISSAMEIPLIDTIVALVAGLVILPACFFLRIQSGRRTWTFIHHTACGVLPDASRKYFCSDLFCSGALRCSDLVHFHPGSGGGLCGG